MKAPPADPMSLFRAGFDGAVEQGVREPGALALATADACGRASNRIVQVIGVRTAGLVFTSHADSRKGRDLAATGWASGVLYWRETDQQVIVTGPVDPLPRRGVRRSVGGSAGQHAPDVGGLAPERAVQRGAARAGC